jgi:CheY-like chemotaxis protein
VAENASRSILIVEDNPTALKLFRLALEAEGYLVRTAADGRSALEQAALQAPDLVLQDLLLPDMDGIQLLGRLRELRAGSTLPVIGISGFKTLLERARSASGFR